MPLIINTNTMSTNAQRHLTNNTNMLSKSLEKLASGFRINRAGDDAAGLQLSENLRAQVRGSQKAYDNVQDGINVLNIADGSMDTITNNLQRMRELAVQAANDTYSAEQRTAINSEIDALRSDIDRIANAAIFNGINLLNTSTPASFSIQLGANDSATVDALNIVSALGDARASTTGGLQITAAASGLIADNSSARAYITVLDAALDRINTKRASLGAFVNRLEGAASNLLNSIENQSSAESRIRNVDVAAESANMTRNQILQQASATVLSQANQSPSLALRLLGG
ncbi:MAG: flagellin [Vampirovibrionales bacterium]|nr:flagellin [Vampirovibrionales bacterium]